MLCREKQVVRLSAGKTLGTENIPNDLLNMSNEISRQNVKV